MEANRFKFRAWDTERQVMVRDGDYWTPSPEYLLSISSHCYAVKVSSLGIHWMQKLQGGAVEYVESNGVTCYSAWESQSLAVDGLILMQSTSLSDKHGNEIFEGDIVTWGFGNTAVEWNTLAAYISDTSKHREPDLITGWFVEDCQLDCKCEVIGNIHENPELLK